ncbi:hypothetical protein RM533_13045 [Croceicoccus sp. F390]|uniref:Secreted protein n=1 Tax=Croceicoccus esteveae TaxID=3075597 RepID=A0ABU2ZKG0_9SPHN|nr:hypothetical protein [Croceicoccus sp. F390]MDT0577092.1 hypothetical protein [Croceicoccus sp. F390]
MRRPAAIARLRVPALVLAVGAVAAVRRTWVLRCIPAPGPLRECHPADAMEQMSGVDDPFADHMDDLAFLPDPSFQTHHCGGHDRAPLRFEAIGPHDAVGDTHMPEPVNVADRQVWRRHGMFLQSGENDRLPV